MLVLSSFYERLFYSINAYPGFSEFEVKSRALRLRVWQFCNPILCAYLDVILLTTLTGVWVTWFCVHTSARDP